LEPPKTAVFRSFEAFFILLRVVFEGRHAINIRQSASMAQFRRFGFPKRLKSNLASLACDSGVEAPAFDIEISSPSPEIALRPGAAFAFKAAITSTVDMRDLDVYLTLFAVGSRGQLLAERVRIEQGASLRQFVVDTTLMLPEGAMGVDSGILILTSPSGTRNVIGSVAIQFVKEP